METHSPWDIQGKTVLVTGGSAGIGTATVVALVEQGAHVIFTSRSAARGEAALQEIRSRLSPQTTGTAQLRLLDLASFASIAAFSEQLLREVPALHVVVHNAGLIQGERRETTDGLEMTFGTNHMGPFYLHQLLEERIRQSAPARIVVVASNAHRRITRGLDFADLQAQKHYDPVTSYSASKLANILFARHLSRRLDGSGITVNSLHPGVVASQFNSVGGAGGLWGFVFTWMRPILLTPERGARTTVFLCTDPSVSTISGAYFKRCKQARPTRAGQDDAAAARLWDASLALCPAPSTPPT